MARRTDHGETSDERSKDHLAHIHSYTQREVEKIRALGKAGHLSIEAVGGVFKELIRASTTNPLIGAAVVCIFADMLQQAKVIQPQTASLIMQFAGVGFAIDISVEILNAVSDFVPWGHSSNQPNVDTIRPTASTVVYGNEAGSGPGHAPTIPAGAVGMVAREAILAA